MHGQMEAAEDALNWHVERALSDSQHALNPRMTAAANEDEAKASNVDHERLLSDGSEPEHHLWQWRQDGNAGGDHARTCGQHNVRTVVTHRCGHVGGYPLGFDRLGRKGEGLAALTSQTADVVRVQMGNDDAVQSLEINFQYIRVLQQSRSGSALSTRGRIETSSTSPIEVSFGSTRLNHDRSTRFRWTVYRPAIPAMAATTAAAPNAPQVTLRSSLLSANLTVEEDGTSYGLCRPTSFCLAGCAARRHRGR